MPGFHHLALTVRDFDASATWYEQLFGLDPVIDELNLHGDGVVLETNRPYLIPLKERLALPAGIRGTANEPVVGSRPSDVIRES